MSLSYCYDLFSFFISFIMCIRFARGMIFSINYFRYYKERSFFISHFFFFFFFLYIFQFKEQKFSLKFFIIFCISFYILFLFIQTSLLYSSVRTTIVCHFSNCALCCNLFNKNEDSFISILI